MYYIYESTIQIQEYLLNRNDDLSNGNEQSKAVPIKPQHLHLKVRLNDPVEFDMYFKAVEDYPLELYYLMDGTYSMKDDKVCTYI